MSGVVIDLQQELLDSNCDILSALRKAHLIASKLNLLEFDSWIQSELSGYNCSPDEIPEYRQISGELKAWNPYHGWIPVLFQNGEMENTICSHKLRDSISAILELKTDSGSFHLNIPADAAREIDKMTTTPLPTKYAVSFSSHLLQVIIDKVKNGLLEWTLTLEKQGIVGANMVFNQSETSAARSVPQQINYYYGTVINGTADHSQISIGDQNNLHLEVDNLVSIIDEIRDSIESEHLSTDDKEIAEEMVEDLKTKIEEKKKPAIIKAALNGLKDFLIGAGANITADIIVSKLIGL